ncbi:glycosyltransferase involved in cell wall biosynthesis [Dysgonomonas alginatilytica]|uniref:Glycosyltransferase involved in cell wall biosynthesis n=1 Tax=Dysgonomonas alginatilytica TaxID=1605892 RepID=A0A2V3PNG7_9BACT|nr:glycosyltransferase family 1 protein [Dysgonomonas alginatilytica]PXV64132.1 glycosyltransferase involved in cell wall biosynthesis [Dysgonomonas alginatilytica]
MKVLYDHQIFEHQRIGGVSRYFAEIIRHLPAGVEADVSVQYAFNEYLKGLNIPFEWKDQLISYYSFLPKINFKGKKRLYSFLQERFPEKYPDFYKINEARTIDKLKKGDFDVFHPTFFGDYYLDHLNGKPYVLTVHDMIIELYPEFINSPQFIKRKKKLVDNAAHIIAVSENTKRDIIDVFGTSADKISVTYHASSLVDGGHKPENLPKKYLLYVGDRRLGYKNFSFFIAAIQPILLENKELCVVCTGDHFTSEENKYFEALGIKDQLKIIFVNDTQLFGLYKSAEMFIYPSYYEGFGIPILEAFQAQCPVVLSNESCFPEVARDAGVYFDSKSPARLRQAVSSLLNNKELRHDMINKGTQRLQNFSWEKSALQTVEIYKEVLR